MSNFRYERIYPPLKGKSGREYKYRMLEDYFQLTGILPAKEIDVLFISMDVYGGLRIRMGYAWDGPSGPMLDTPTALRASMIHDALYQLIRMGYLPIHVRKAADKLFRQICRADGMNRARAWTAYWSVRAFARRAAKRRRT